MQSQQLLYKFPVLRSQDPEELRQWLRPVFAVNGLNLPEHGKHFDGIVNHCELSSFGLTYASYKSPLQARISQTDYFVHGFPVKGSGEVHWNRHSALVDPQRGGVVGGPGSEATINYGASFEHVVLKMTPAALTRKLTALIGKPVDPPLKLTGRPNSNPAYLARQRRLIGFLIEEIDRADDVLPPLVLAELEQAIIVSYLLAADHNYSTLLHHTPRAAAPWQVRRAIDYIEQYWDEPVAIETLVEVTQTSARSLFYLFRRTYGISPLTYVNQVRLRHARAMLSSPTPETSVTTVGFRCGFSNMGMFARKYYEAYGEKPSETLKTYR